MNAAPLRIFFARKDSDRLPLGRSCSTRHAVLVFVRPLDNVLRNRSTFPTDLFFLRISADLDLVEADFFKDAGNFTLGNLNYCLGIYRIGSSADGEVFQKSKVLQEQICRFSTKRVLGPYFIQFYAVIFGKIKLGN